MSKTLKDLKHSHPFLERLAKTYGALKHVPRRARGFLRWMFSSPGSVLPLSGLNGRLLVVYDLSGQPFSYGDLLMMQGGAVAVAGLRGLFEIDLAIVYDEKDPVGVSYDTTPHLDRENIMYHLTSIMPIAHTNQLLRGLFVFDSHVAMQRYIFDNTDRYSVWPGPWKYIRREYLYFHILNRVIPAYHRKFKTMPRLTCRDFLRKWAEGFFAAHAAGKTPVTVNIRNNPKFGTNRNSNMPAWRELFSYCESRYPVTFVVVCARNEVDDSLREHKNVVIAKDHFTDAGQDHALVHMATFHMGTGSGPMSMAWFNTKPYLMVNWTADLKRYTCVEKEDEYLRFSFSSPLQYAYYHNETPELLIDYFKKAWDATNKSSSGQNA